MDGSGENHCDDLMNISIQQLFFQRDEPKQQPDVSRFEVLSDSQVCQKLQKEFHPKPE